MHDRATIIGVIDDPADPFLTTIEVGCDIPLLPSLISQQSLYALWRQQLRLVIGHRVLDIFRLNECPVFTFFGILIQESMIVDKMVLTSSRQPSDTLSTTLMRLAFQSRDLS